MVVWRGSEGGALLAFWVLGFWVGLFVVVAVVVYASLGGVFARCGFVHYILFVLYCLYSLADPLQCKGVDITV